MRKVTVEGQPQLKVNHVPSNICTNIINKYQFDTNIHVRTVTLTDLYTTLMYTQVCMSTPHPLFKSQGNR